jgi:hypothetical protein
MKYEIILTGWEYHIQSKSLNKDQVEIAINEINEVTRLEEIHLSGNADFETCSLELGKSINIEVYDRDQNLVLQFRGNELSHYEELDELYENEWNKYVNINPVSSESYENTLYLENNYSGSIFCFEIESDSKPRIEDFSYSYLCIETPNGDIDLLENLIFKSNVLIGDISESGKHKGKYMNVFSSDGDVIEIG